MKMLDKLKLIRKSLNENKNLDNRYDEDLFSENVYIDKDVYGVANRIFNQYKKDSAVFSFGTITVVGDSIDFETLEQVLMDNIPNLVITHRDTDTFEDLKEQLKRLKEINSEGLYPHFIDFCNVDKEKTRNRK